MRSRRNTRRNSKSIKNKRRTNKRRTNKRRTNKRRTNKSKRNLRSSHRRKNQRRNLKGSSARPQSAPPKMASPPEEWSTEEEKKMVELYKLYGSSWKTISTELTDFFRKEDTDYPEFTANECEAYFKWHENRLKPKVD